MSRAPIRILHAADWHLNAEPTVGRLDPATGLPVRFLDQKRLLERLVGLAVSERVDAVLISGDLFDKRRPSPLVYRTAQNAITALNAMGIPVYVLGGNHDGEPAAGQVSAVDVMQPQLGDVVAGGPEVLRTEPFDIVALPHLGRAQLLARDTYKDASPEAINQILAEKQTALLRSLQAERKAGKPTVLMMHATVTGATLAGEQEVGIMAASSVVLNLHDILDLKYDLVALGHLHRGQTVEEGVHYAGSLYRVNFGEAAETKGVWIHELEPGQPTRSRFHDLEDRPYITLDVRRMATSDLARVKGAVVRFTGTLTPEEAAAANPGAMIRQLEDFGALAVSWQVETARTAAVRVSGMSEALGPKEALDLYLAEHPELPVEAVRDRGRSLIDGERVDARISAFPSTEVLAPTSEAVTV